MKKFKLELFVKIIGIGSASGLICVNDSLYVISDNSNYLYEYNLLNADLKKHLLFDNAAVNENIPKKMKSDFEAITKYEDDIFVVGSGSTMARNKMIQISEAEKTVLQNHDLTDLYLSMQYFAGISAEEFNIEGVIFTGEKWYFFQRGNGATAKNGIFTVDSRYFTQGYSLQYTSYKLPKIKKVTSSFTDAILVDDTFYFLASAEDSKSTYHDGAVMGSSLGTIDAKTMKLKKVVTITESYKLEGITLFKNTDKTLEFLLCEDQDSDVQEAQIFKLTLNK
ncbi:DUF6929 domain-containing protein [Flavobacterium antarcticum]|uniref:DUF6929 family protein n=1 Tax=Flavobacterium antarcticum TaxID=271155 RepID=UPI0003B6BB62|nr:hypothetical protein [Flavobacterium antarcticum]